MLYSARFLLAAGLALIALFAGLVFHPVFFVLNAVLVIGMAVEATWQEL